MSSTAVNLAPVQTPQLSPEKPKSEKSYFTQAKEAFFQASMPAKIATIALTSALGIGVLAATYSYYTAGNPGSLATLESLREEYGEGRTLSLVESGEENHGLYGRMLKSIPERLNKSFFSPYNENDARQAYEFRNLARDYTRERSWWIVEKYLNFAEKRDRPFEEYFRDYNYDSSLVVQKAMTPNHAWHNEAFLQRHESILNGFDMGGYLVSLVSVAALAMPRGNSALAAMTLAASALSRALLFLF